MQGTEKQIAWAAEIKPVLTPHLVATRAALDTMSAETAEEMTTKNNIIHALDKLLASDLASDWIEMGSKYVQHGKISAGWLTAGQGWMASDPMTPGGYPLLDALIDNLVNPFGWRANPRLAPFFKNV